jgi:hypothetical protein
MTLNTFRLVGLLYSVIVPALVYAEQAKDPLSTTGFIDGSFNYLQNSNLFTSNVYNRVYDLNENGFTLQQAAGTISYLPDEGFGLLFNGMVGRDAITSNAYGMGVGTNSPDFGVDITQGYLNLNHDTISVNIGKFTTINGAETIAPNTNTNFSRSILFGYAGPFTTLGIRSTYKASERLKLIAGIDDGWDTIRDFTKGQTLELNGSYEFNKAFSLALTGYYGKQRATDRVNIGPIGNRSLIDVLGTFTLSPKCSVLINYDYAWQTVATLADSSVGRALWNGVAGYVNYQWTDRLKSSFRGEVFNDSQGYRTGVAQQWDELTFTFAYQPLQNKNLLLRFETRHDFSNVRSFLAKNGLDNDYQQSYAVEALYQFG